MQANDRKRQWQEFADFEILQEILDDFALVTGISSVIMRPDKEHERVTRQTLPHNRLCMELIKGTSFGRQRCNKCDQKWGAEAVKDKTYKVYTCENGLVDFVSPIVFESQVLGYLFGGQVRVLEDAKAKERQVKYAKEIGLDPDRYLEALKRDVDQHFRPEELVDPDKYNEVLERDLREGRITVLPRGWYARNAEALGIDPSEYLEALDEITVLPKDRIDAAARILHNIANHISMLTTQWIEEAEQSRHKEKILAGFQKSVADTATEVDAQVILQSIAEQTAELVKADVIVLYEYWEHTRDVKVPPITWGEIWHPQILDGRGQGRPHEKSAVIKMLDRRRKEAVYAPDARRVWEQLLHKEGTPEGFLEREEIVSSAAIRLTAEGERVGVLFVNYRTPHAFPDEEQRIIQFFATQAASAIRNARLRADLQRQVDRLEMLSEVSYQLNTKLDETSIYDAVVEAVVRTLDCTHCTFFGLEKNSLIPLASASKTEGKQVTRRFAIGEGFAGWVAQRGRAILASDAKADKRFSQGITNPNVDRSMIVVPVRVEGEIVGVISVDQDRVNAFNKRDLQMVKTLALQTETAVQNATLLNQERRLYRQRITDLEAIEAINKAIASGERAETPAPDPMLQLIVDRLVDVFQAACCVIRLCDPNTGQLGDRIASGTRAWDVEYPPRKRGASQYILETGNSVYAADTTATLPNGETVIKKDLRRVDIQSVAYLPLLSEGQVLGVLYVDWSEPREFTRHDRLILELFAQQTAIAIENARRYDQRRDDIAALREINEAITTAQWTQIPKLVVRKAHELTQATYVALWLVNDDGKFLSIEAIHGREANVNQMPIDEHSITGWVAQTGKAHRIDDVSQDPHYAEWYEDVRSSMAVPLNFDKTVIGVLTVESTRLHAFSDHQSKLLDSLADQAAIAIENARVFENYKKQIGVLEVVNEVGQIISNKLEPTDLLQTIVSQIALQLDCTHCTLFLAEQEEDGIWLVPQVTHGRTEVLSRHFKPGEGLAGWVFQEGESLVLDDARQDARFAPYREAREKPRSMLVAPIKVGDQTIGVISADQDQFSWFDESGLKLVEGLALQAGIAIQRAIGLQLLEKTGKRIVGLRRNMASTLIEIVSGAIKLTNTTTGIIYLIGEDGRSIEDSYCPPGYNHPPPRIDRENGLTHTVIATGEPELIPDIHQDPRVNPFLRDDFQSMIAMPLKSEQGVIGVLFLNDEQSHEFTETEVSLLQTLASLAAVAIENVRLYMREMKL